jgi:hypothetical protein
VSWCHGEGTAKGPDEEFRTADIEEQTRKGVFSENARDGLMDGSGSSPP